MDSEWRRRSRRSEADPEEAASQRRWAARLSGEPYLARDAGEWRQVQLAAYRGEEEALRVLGDEVLALLGRDPRWTALAAFLGDVVAAEALGVEVDPPSHFDRWVDCLHYWAGGEAHLRAAVAVAEALPVRGRGLGGVLRAARRYVASPGRLNKARYLRAADSRRFRSPSGGIVIWCFAPPASCVVLERVLEAARGLGACDEILREVITDALLAWARGGSSPGSPPSPSIR